MKKLFMIGLLLFSVSLFAKEISITSEDGFVLKGWINYPKTVKETYPIVFLSHEFGSESSMWKDMSMMMRERGYATFEMDLRGHGKSILQNGKENKIVDDIAAEHLQNSIRISEKQVNFKEIPNDLTAWLEVLGENEKIDMDNLVFFGSSLGGGAVMPLLMEFEPKTVILFSPGSSTPKDLISNSDANILIFTSQSDFAFTRSLDYAKRALTPTFITLPGSGHGSALFELSKPFLKVYLDKYLK